MARNTKATVKEIAGGIGFIGEPSEVPTFDALESPAEALRQIQSLLSIDAEGLRYYGTALRDQGVESETMAMMLALARALYLEKAGQALAPSLVEKAKEVSREPLPTIEAVESWDGEIVDGTYTVVLPGGDYRTLRIRTQAPDASFKPGSRIISFLNGPDNWRNYQGFGEVLPGNQLKVWQKHESATTIITCASILLSGPEAMVDGLKAYGKASGSCGICGRKLTTPESIELGIGPVCAGKMGL